mmetsp:Transcript_32021/g.83807  ORF Transcript_32021/g.83807 Transcript_32021/m.83807 type:complete len:396 (-) Transcript_32021:879-2066(-)
MHANEDSLLVANFLLSVGFLVISACKAGVTVAEFSTVGQLGLSFSGLSLAFACVILSKHAISILLSWGVPRLLATANDEMTGIGRVQLALLIPHMISVAAGIQLARLSTTVSAHGSHAASQAPAGLWIHRATSEVVPADSELPQVSPATFVATSMGLSPANSFSRDKSASPSSLLGGTSLVVVLIGLWRALAVGTLHAYHSIRIKFMQSRGLVLTQAGSLFATYDGIGILLLPAICLLTRRTGLKPMLSLLPLLTIAAMLCLLFTSGSGVAVDAALLTISIIEVFAPIIPLALLPANARKLGAAYGAIEVMMITLQMMIVLLLGIVRTESGYTGAFLLLTGSCAAAVVVSLPLALHSKDQHLQQEDAKVDVLGGKDTDDELPSLYRAARMSSEAW